MPDPPPQVYARQLFPLGYGYPLWTPEPSNQFLRYRRDGLRIGDVGVVDTEDGSFDVFFNICLPSEHPFHRVNGVPDNFVRIDLNELDMAVYPHAENPGSVISTSSVTTRRTLEPLSQEGTNHQNPLTYEFRFSSSEGALLILPDGAERHTLRKRNVFRDAATKNGIDWYKFAEEKLGRIISHDSLYLITGCYKTNSWSVAAFHEASSHTGEREFLAQYKVDQQRHGAYTWETTRALYWRAGPLVDYSNGIPSQAVFISGFKIGLRDRMLGKKCVEVEVNASPTDIRHRKFVRDGTGQSRIGKLWTQFSSRSGGNSGTENESVSAPASEACDGSVDSGGHVTVSHIPGSLQSFHPSDVINRYLLTKEPTAAVAVTHDSQWSILFEQGMLKLEDLSNDGKLENVMLKNHCLVSRDGVVSLRRSSDSSIRLTDMTDVVREAWKADRLHDAEEKLSNQTVHRTGSDHTILAHRALIRSRLHQWDTALRDAEMSADIQPSVTAHVAKGFALFGQEKHALAVNAFNDALRECDVSDEPLVLLIKSVVLFQVGYHAEAMADVVYLTEHCPIAIKPACTAAQVAMYLRLAMEKLVTNNENYDEALQLLRRAQSAGPVNMVPELHIISMICGWKFENLLFKTHQQICDVLYLAERANEAVESFLEMMFDLGEDIKKDNLGWITTFIGRCLETLEGYSESARASQAYTEATAHYLVTLSADQAIHNRATVKAALGDEAAITDLTLPSQLLKIWTKVVLASSSWQDALAVFPRSRFVIYRAICEELVASERVTDAAGCFHQMLVELGEENLTKAAWVSGFEEDILQRLEHLGDISMHAEHHDEAIAKYSIALSLDPTSSQGFLIKRSKAYIAMGLWQNALEDADKAIALDLSSPYGHEQKHAALHGAGRYDDAISAFETMLFKISQSPDPKIRECLHDYVNPAQTKAVIRKTVQCTIRDSPRVLIHTVTGRLLDKSKQASLFESLPVFKKLISSMTTHINHDHIQQEVEGYYRYATFSHTWEDNEPLFEQVTHIVVYDLIESFTHNKLQMFCKIARDSGLYWAWSDTCCIDKSDHAILQEALVAMFKWYEGSAVTIVFLRGVHSPSQPGDLVRSMWNTRGWTFQEYHASKVVRFYTEDWNPYLNLDIANHKESPEVISEMEVATGMDAQILMGLQPGLQDIRKKLCLASGRETSLVEDAAYSLLGIFSVALPIVYGEGDRALGRLLAQLLTSAGDTSILAWTGKSGNFNSCLPASITVFSGMPTSHIPNPITDFEMEVTRSASSPNVALVMELYDRLHGLPLPSVVNQRMGLPCLTFRLGPIRRLPGGVFRARTGALGAVEIRTTEDLSQYSSLTLVHPWVDYLLDRHPAGNINRTIIDTSHRSSSASRQFLSTVPLDTAQTLVKKSLASRLVSSIRQTLNANDTISLLSPALVSQQARRTQALWFVARLRQPFGALLFTPKRQNVEEYRRVAPESLIRVQVRGLTTAVLNQLKEDVRVLDVL